MDSLNPGRLSGSLTCRGRCSLLLATGASSELSSEGDIFRNLHIHLRKLLDVSMLEDKPKSESFPPRLLIRPLNAPCTAVFCCLHYPVLFNDVIW